MSNPSINFEKIDDDENQNIRVKATDSWDNEFRYYTKLLQELFLTVNTSEDRLTVLSWVRKLSGPGYNVTALRDKRNRFMLMLCMSLILGSAEGPFAFAAPFGILPEINQLEIPEFAPFEFEEDNTWEEQIKALQEINQVSDETRIVTRCALHYPRGCPKSYGRDKHIGEALDKHFRYLLYLIKPYAALLQRSSDRIRAGKWIQALCSIDQEYCTITKGIRNDYMMVFLGHIANQHLVGPFEDLPLDKITPIADMAKDRSEKKPITDATHPRTIEFFQDVPTPDEGAFAYVAITGDLYQPKNP